VRPSSGILVEASATGLRRLRTRDMALSESAARANFGISELRASAGVRDGEPVLATFGRISTRSLRPTDSFWNQGGVSDTNLCHSTVPCAQGTTWGRRNDNTSRSH
jgi:hypothetical protein